MSVRFNYEAKTFRSIDTVRIFNDAGRVFAAETLGFVLVERGHLTASGQIIISLIANLGTT